MFVICLFRFSNFLFLAFEFLSMNSIVSLAWFVTCSSSFCNLRFSAELFPACSIFPLRLFKAVFCFSFSLLMNTFALSMLIPLFRLKIADCFALKNAVFIMLLRLVRSKLAWFFSACAFLAAMFSFAHSLVSFRFAFALVLAALAFFITCSS